jgi:quercetin dioxygenase-like cupin family protein
MSEYAKIIHLAEGIQIVDDVTAQFGVETLEGTVGPLLRGATGTTQFFDMPPGLFVAEHPHTTESFIYTVRGRWVLCSGGQRHVMQPGSLFWFGPNIPTGYETPFPESAFILIFKSQYEGTLADMVDYLQNSMRPHLIEQAASGQEVFTLAALPVDHPARRFARQVNPANDQ